MYVNGTGLPPTIALGDELVLFARLLKNSALDAGEPGRGIRMRGWAGRRQAGPNLQALSGGPLTLFQRPASLSPAGWTAPPPLQGQTATSLLPWPGGLWFWHEQLSLPAGEVLMLLILAISGLWSLNQPSSSLVHAEARGKEEAASLEGERFRKASTRGLCPATGILGKWEMVAVHRGHYLPPASSLFPGTLLY